MEVKNYLQLPLSLPHWLVLIHQLSVRLRKCVPNAA